MPGRGTYDAAGADEPRLVAEPAEPARSCTRTPPQSDPMGEAFNYAEEFKTLDLDAVKQDITR